MNSLINCIHSLTSYCGVDEKWERSWGCRVHSRINNIHSSTIPSGAVGGARLLRADDAPRPHDPQPPDRPRRSEPRPPHQPHRDERAGPAEARAAVDGDGAGLGVADVEEAGDDGLGRDRAVREEEVLRGVARLRNRCALTARGRFEGEAGLGENSSHIHRSGICIASGQRRSGGKGSIKGRLLGSCLISFWWAGRG